MTDEERLIGLLNMADPVAAGITARALLRAGVTVPPAPVDPAWMADAVSTMYGAAVADGTVANGAHVDLLNLRVALRELLAAGYRVIPPTQDRAAVIEKARTVYARRFNDPDTFYSRRGFEALYDAHMLVEGDGR